MTIQKTTHAQKRLKLLHSRFPKVLNTIPKRCKTC